MISRPRPAGKAFPRIPLSDIRAYAGVIEHRPDDSDCTLESVRAENAEMLRMCRTYGSDYISIDDDYRVDIDLTR